MRLLQDVSPCPPGVPALCCASRNAGVTVQLSGPLAASHWGWDALAGTPILLLCPKASGAESLRVSAGIIEGFKVEKASLQEALGQKETAEQGLAVELESLRQQLQQAARQQAELKEENSALCAQKEALAAEAEEREAGKSCWLRGGRRAGRRAGAGAAVD